MTHKILFGLLAAYAIGLVAYMADVRMHNANPPRATFLATSAR